MRKWNKLLALLLAMVMVFGLTATAFAEGAGQTEDEKTNEDAVQDAVDEITGGKTDGEDAKEPAEGEEDKTPAEGEDAKTPAEGEEDKTPAEGEDAAEPTEPADEIDYTGVDEWAKEAVAHVVGELKLIALRETGLEPKATMTRAEMVAALYALAESPEVEEENRFADVADDASYKDAVLWANANEIVQGVSPARFDPDGELTRQQIAVFLYRYAKYAKVDVTVEGDNLADAPDADKVETWANAEMNWAVANKMITGSDGGKLLPNDPAQRQMVAAILSRYINNILTPAEPAEPAEGDDAAEPTEPAEDAKEPAEGDKTDDAAPADGDKEPAEGEDAKA